MVLVDLTAVDFLGVDLLVAAAFLAAVDRLALLAFLVAAAFVAAADRLAAVDRFGVDFFAVDFLVAAAFLAAVDRLALVAFLVAAAFVAAADRLAAVDLTAVDSFVAAADRLAADFVVAGIFCSFLLAVWFPMPLWSLPIPRRGKHMVWRGTVRTNRFPRAGSPGQGDEYPLVPPSLGWAPRRRASARRAEA
jgi:hypothetical protein